MRLLFLSSVHPTPAEPTKGTYNRALVDALAREHEVTVVVPVPWPAAWSAERMPSGPRTRYPVFFYTPGFLRGLHHTFLWWSVRAHLRDLAPDAVLGYWTYPDGAVAVRAARTFGVPAVLVVGGSDVLVVARDGHRRERIRRVLAAADMVLAVGKDLRDSVIALGIEPSKVRILERGVDPALFGPGDRKTARRMLGLPIDRALLLWVGRMTEVKGLDVLVDACAALAARGVDFVLGLAGDGPLRGSVQRHVARAGLASRVHFFGTVAHERLADLYRAADVTVLPSRSEGVPNVLRESLACGTPFVASRVGGVPELSRDPARELVEPGDTEALARALEAALCDPPAVVPPPTTDAAATVIDAVRDARRTGDSR